jgi:SSS family solute:Na+ symporter
MAKLVSLIVKAGALVFIFALPLEYAIQLQLLGGIWIIQILPALVLGLRWRFLNGWALLIGWAVGTGVGTWMAWLVAFKGATYTFTLFGLAIPGYAAIYSVIVNIAVAAILSPIFSAMGASRPAVPAR